MFPNLQSWPTPEMFIRLGQPSNPFPADMSVLLVSVVSLTPETAGPVVDVATAAAQLVSCSVSLSLNVSETESATHSVLLNSCLRLLPQTATQTESGNAGLSLVSCIQLTPSNASETETVNNNVSLVSCVV